MTGGCGGRVGSGQIEFTVRTDKIMMANRDCDYKEARSWDLPNGKETGRMRNANCRYHSLITDFVFH